MLNGFPKSFIPAFARGRLVTQALPALFFAAITAVSGCSKTGNDELASGLYGIRISSVAGDQQTCRPGILCKVPLKVRVVDSLLENPLPLTNIVFSQVGGSDILLLTPQVLTDADGYALTQIKMPPSPTAKYTLEARAEGTSAAVQFTITTEAVGGGLRLIADTTHGNSEVAGVPFGIKLQVNDDYGQLVSTYNGTVNLIWTIQTSNSWDGSAPTLPTGVVPCTFTNGVCLTATNYVLTDSSATTYINVGDGPGGFEDVQSKPITVQPGAKTRLVIVDKPGGPKGVDGDATTLADNAKVLVQPFVFNADMAAQKFYAAAVDVAGNYIEDASYATWTSTSAQITNYLTSAGPALSTQFTPTKTLVSGTLTVSGGGLTAINHPLTVNPGAPKNLQVSTEHAQTEDAGKIFAMNVNALDAKGNVVGRNADGTGGFQGTFTTSVQMANDASGPALSAGCNRFLLPAEPYFTVTGNCQSRNYSQTFVDGVGTVNIYGLLNDATSVSPTITMTTLAQNGYPSLTGTTPVINVVQGPPDHLILNATAGGHGDFVCNLDTAKQSQNETKSCISKSAGDPVITYYATLEDRAGNFLGNPTVQWTYLKSYFGGSQWSTASGTSAQSSAFNPSTGGWGHVVVSDPVSGITTDLGGLTQVAPIDHFVISVSDGTNTVNTLSVLKSHALTIELRDAQNNRYHLNGTYGLTTTYTGAHASPKGTAAVVPLTGMQTLNFVDGISTISTGTGGANLRLPNSADVVTINVTDGTHVSNALTPSLLPGALTTIKIKTGPNDSGTDVTGAAINITTDNTPTYYMGLYDAELNYLGVDNTTVWDGTISSVATVPTPGASSMLNPTNVGSGYLRITARGLTAQTGTITVAAGTLDHLSINSQHNGTEAAGVPFSMRVELRDRRNNLAQYFNGTRTLSWGMASTQSLAGIYPTAPASGTCNFTAGVCMVSGIVLTDSRSPTTFSLNDGQVSGVASYSVAVTTGSKSSLMIVAASGNYPGLSIHPQVDPHQLKYAGSSQPGASWNGDYLGTADDPAIKFKAVAVDAAGNYVEDATYAVWSGDVPEVTNYLSATTGALVTYTPTKTVNGHLIISDSGAGGGLGSYSIPFYLMAGAVAKLKVSSEHGNSEVAGVPFKIIVQLTDDKNNVITGFNNGNYSGTYAASISYANDNSAPMVTGGCAWFKVPGGHENFKSTFPCAQSISASLTLVDGAVQANGAVVGQLNDATGVAPTITVAIPSLSLTGTSPVISVTQGPPSRLVLHTGNTSTDLPLCYLGYDFGSCLDTVAGTSPSTYYAALEDLGGNVISYPAIDWHPAGTALSDWSPVTNSNSSTFNPHTAGGGALTLTYNSIQTVYSGTTQQAPIDHYQLTASDGTNTTNNVSVLKNYTLTITAQDKFNNTVSLNGDYPLTLNVTGAIASVKGSAPVLPTLGTSTYHFVNGITSVSNLKLPNAMSSVNFSLVDAASKTGTLVPAVLPGPLDSIQIRTSAGNNGTNVVGATLSYSADVNPTFYVAEYDSELNYIGYDNTTTWNWSNPAIATVSSPGFVTVLSTNTAGSGVLKATLGALQVQTGTITITAGSAKKFFATTTHTNAETAGTPFGFIIKVLDNNGNTNTAYTGNHTLSWTMDSWLSWTGATPTLPSGTVSCNFNAGVCNTGAIYTVVDARRPTTFTVGDGSSLSPYTASITVAAGPKSKFAIADKPGGPKGADGNLATTGDNAQVFAPGLGLCTFTTFQTCAWTGKNTDSPPVDFYAAAVDASGNYIEDPAAYVSWSGSASYVSSQITATGSHAVFTPYVVGLNGNVTASGGGLTAANYGLLVDPGALHHLVVSTQHANSEMAGVGFQVILTAQDAHNNVLGPHFDGSNAYQGAATVNFTFNNDASAPPVSSGCGRFYSTYYYDNYVIPDFSTVFCNRSMSYAVSFVNGVANTSATSTYAVLNDATSVTPTIRADVPAISGFNAVSGTSPVITVNVGPANRIVPHRTLGDHGDFICGEQPIREYYDNIKSCRTAMVGDSTTTWYAALEDAGGNFLGNVAVDWNTQGSYVGNWSPTSATQSSVFTPTTGGDGIVALTNGSITTHIHGKTQYAPLDHYEVIAYDGTDSVNNISALGTFSLDVRAKDSYNNTIPLNGNVSLQVSFAGASPSPKGTAVVSPAGGFNTYPQANGVVTIQNLRLPNSGNTVTITATDGTKSGSITPTILAGPATKLSIRTAANNGGVDRANAAFSIPSDTQPTFYVGAYDTEGNYLGGSSSSAAWSFSDTTVANVGPSGGYSAFMPVKAGTGVLTLTYASLTVSTGTITVTAGTPKGFVATTTHSGTEAAGVPFGFVVKLVDTNGVVVSTYNQSTPLTWSYISADSWGGVAPNLPNGQIACTFTNGVCNTATTYTVTDARQLTSYSVGDGPGGLTDDTESITVTPGAATQLIIADQAGGPAGLDGNLATTADNAAVYAGNQRCVAAPKYTCLNAPFNVDNGAVTLSAARVDAYGNYVAPATGVTWSGNQPYISGARLSSTTGTTITLDARQTGNGGTLTVSDGALTPYSISPVVDPGVPHHLTIATEHAGTESPGIPFKLIVTAVDQRGNAVTPPYFGGNAGFSGNFNVNFAFAGDASSPAVDGGCGRIYQPGLYTFDKFAMPDGLGHCNRTFSYALNFGSGVADLGSQGFLTILNDATGVTPVISASVPAQNGFGALSGASPAVSISVGPAHHLTPVTSVGNNGSFVCNYVQQYNTNPNSYSPCIFPTVGDPSVTYYAALYDAGGNFIQNEAVTWTPGGAFNSDWTNPGQSGNSSTFTPLHGGAGTITLSDGTITSQIVGRTKYAPLDHYRLTVNDGLDSPGTVAANRPFTLQIDQMDAYNNVIPNNNTVQLNVSFSGAHASPAGTAVAAPTAGTVSYVFSGGTTKINSLRLPNSGDTVTITVTDGTVTNTLQPSLIAGPPAALKIMTAAGGTGGDLTNLAYSVASDARPTYYVIPYDSEQNLCAAFPSSATWNFSTAVATTSSPGGTTNFVPVTSGTGVLSVSYASLTASTGTITIVAGAPKYYVATTTHGNAETPGVPFGFTVKITDANGITVQSVNGAQNLVWNSSSWPSWTGQTPNMPTGTISCTFTNGVCNTATTYTVTDARRPTTYSVGDGPGGLSDDSEAITVTAGAKTALVIANKAGGPAANANIYVNDQVCSYAATSSCGLAVFNADQASAKFSAAAVDAYGNYVEDASYATWAGSAAYISSNLSPASGTTVTVVPQQTGTTGTLTASYGGLTSGSMKLVVDPGAANHFVVATEHSNSESPGVAFKVSVKAVDAKNNVLVQKYNGLPGYTGNFSTTFTFANDASAPATDAGCARFYNASNGIWDNFVVPDFSAVNCGRSYVYSLSFLNGIADTSNQGIYALLNDATGVSPTISATAGAQNGFVAMTGQTPTIAISVGPDARIVPFTQLGDTGSFACNYQIQSYVNYTDAGGPCIARTAGDAATTYYAAMVDAGGNFKRNLAVNWNTQDAYSSDWSPTSGTQTSTFTPVHGGDGTVTLTNGAISTRIRGKTNVATLHHFDVLAYDGTDPTNTLSAVSPYNLQLRTKDAQNNLIPTNGSVNVTISYTGATASPAATNPIVPATGVQSITFTNGYATISGLRLPNASNTVVISVTDGSSHNGTLTPTLIPGSVTAIKIRDAGTNGGSNLTTQPVTITTDVTPTYYLARYDAEGNYVDGNPQGTWSVTNSLGTFGSPTGSSSAFNPTTTGTGTLSVSLVVGGSTLTASTGTFTVNPGALDHFSIATQHGGYETAGVAFNTTVTMQDRQNNTLTNYTGSISLAFNVLNNNGSPRGNGNSWSSNGNYTFTNGVATSGNFTFYNASYIPVIQVTGNVKSGQTSVSVGASTFQNFQFNRGAPSISAGGSVTWTIYASDAWGNQLTTGGAATAGISLNFASSLAGTDITATTLTGATSVAGANDTTVSGNLSGGQATVTATATGAGSLQLRKVSCSGTCPAYANPTTDTYNDVTVLPLSTINSLAFRAGATPPTSYQVGSGTMSFTVQALDVYGNVISTDSSSVITLTMPGASRSFGGNGSVTLVNGQAAFSGITYPYVENITLLATSPNSKTVSQGVTVTTGFAAYAIARLPDQTYTPGQTSLSAAITGTAFSVTPAPKAGAAFPVELRIVDSGYNTITTNNGQVRVKSSDANYTLGSFSNFASGVVSISTTLTTVGTYTVSADTQGVVTELASSNVTVSPGARAYIGLALQGQSIKPGVSSLTFTGTPVAPVAGTPFNVTAYALDSYYNRVTGDTTTVTLAQNSTPTDSQIVLPAGAALVNGQQTFSVTYKTVNAGYSLKSTSAPSTPALATSTFGVTGSTADHLVIAGTVPANPSAVVGTTIAPKVQVVDAYGNAVSGTTVTYSNVSGAGSIVGGYTSVVSDASGNAPSQFTLGTTAGTNNMQFQATNAGLPGSPKTITYTVSGTPAADNKLVFTTQPATSAAAGTAFTTQPVVKVQDTYGNVTSSTVSIALSAYTSSDCSTTPNGGTFNANGTMNASAGTATFSGATYSKASTFYVKATSGALTSACSTASLTQAANSPTKLIFTNFPAQASGSCSTYTVQPQDANGNPATIGTATSVSASSSTGHGTFYASDCSTTTLPQISGGSYTFGFRDDTAETTTITLAVSGLTSATQTVAVTSAGAASLAFTSFAGGATAGTAFSPGAVQFKDAAGNATGSGLGGITITGIAAYAGAGCSGAPNGTLSPTSVSITPNGSGAATISNVTYTKAESISIKVTASNGWTACTPSTIPVSAGALSKLAFSAGPSGTVTAATAFSPQPSVIGQDANGNTVPLSTAVTLSAATDGTCGTGTGYPVTNGTQSISSGTVNFSGASYGHAGASPVFLKATTTVSSTNYTGCSTSSFTVNASTPTVITVYSGNSQSGAAGAALGSPLVVQVADAGGNLASGVTVSFTLGGGASGGSLSTTSIATDVNGRASTNFTLGTTAGSQTVTATIPGPYSVTFSATATPAAAYQLIFATQPAGNQTVGKAFPTQPRVFVLDQYGNQVTGGGTAITLAPYASGTGCGTAAGGSLTNASGSSTAGSLTFANVSYSAAATIQLQATASGLQPACSSAITVYPTLALTPITTTPNVNAADTLDASGGVPGALTFSITTNASGGSLGSSTSCNGSDTCIDYTPGPIGGNTIIDTVKVTDAAGNTATANLTIQGAHLVFSISGTQPSNYGFGSQFADTNVNVALKNIGNATSGAITVNVPATNPGSAPNIFTVDNTANCNGATLAANGFCLMVLNFKASTGGVSGAAPPTGAYSITLGVSTSPNNGGSFSFPVTGTVTTP